MSLLGHKKRRSWLPIDGQDIFEQGLVATGPPRACRRPADRQRAVGASPSRMLRLGSGASIAPAALVAALIFAGCPGPAAVPDGSLALDAPPEVDGGGRLDASRIDTGTLDGGSADGGSELDGGGGVDGGGIDGGERDAAAPSDGGGRVTGADLCAALGACFGFSLPMCDVGTQTAIDRAEGFGCGDEGDVANRCTLRITARADGGTCAPDYFSCDADYGALNACMVTATGIAEFSCVRADRCTTTRGSADDPTVACSPAIGTLVASCPTTGRRGSCVTAPVGGASVETNYYDPLPVGTSLAALQAACETPPSGPPGVWTTF